MFANYKLTLLPFVLASYLHVFKCNPYYSEFEDFCDNSVSSSMESYPEAEDYDSPTLQDSPDEQPSYVSCPKCGVHRRPRPRPVPAHSHPYYLPRIPHYPPPIIITNKSARPHRTLLSPIGRLINSFVRTVFPGAYYDDDY